MINLLPSDMKTSLAFAHHNTKLIKIIIGLGIGTIGIILILAVGYLYLQQEVNSAKTSIKDSEASLKQQNETETLARAQEINSSLTLVVDVLSQEILFSKLLREVASVIPPNTVLQDLSLSSELDGALNLEIGAKDYNAATQVQVNLEQRPDSIFERADLNGVNCRTADAEDAAYPCTANLTAIFSKDNNFTLLGGKD
jgi:Tfp pilus assembly protein PilN